MKRVSNYLQKVEKHYFWFFQILTFVFLFMPGNKITESGDSVDKVVHILLFFLVSFFTFHYIRKPILLIALIMLAYSGFSEILQYVAIPGRTGDILDFYADGVGILVAILAFWPYRKFYL